VSAGGPSVRRVRAALGRAVDAIGRESRRSIARLPVAVALRARRGVVLAVARQRR
jgi:hypothetical protein